MGYDVHITKRQNWFDKGGPEISVTEWATAVAADPEMPLDGYAEGQATLRLFNDLVQAYGDKAKNVFTSADGKHKIYALAQGR